MMHAFLPRWARLAAAPIAALFLLAGSATGAEQTASLTAADRADIARAQGYLNSVRSLESTFIQTASNGGVAEGTLYLQRPGKLRIDYRPPNPLQIYTDGFWLIYLDSELKEVNQVPLSQTPAAFLVRDKISLSGDISVDRVTRRRGTIELHLTQADNPDAGRLIVTLAEKPMALRGWSVVDAQGVRTTVTLLNPAVNPHIDPKVFVYSPPDWAFPESPD